MKEFIALLLCALLTFGGLALGETEAAEESGPVLVEAGYAHSFAIARTARFWAWGSNEYGRLGTGMSMGIAFNAEEIELEGVVEASAGWYHSLFRTEDGSVYAVGATTTLASLATAAAWIAACP